MNRGNKVAEKLTVEVYQELTNKQINNFKFTAVVIRFKHIIINEEICYDQNTI